MSERNHVKDQLADYAVGGLSGRARTSVEQHLRECDECRAELAALERTGDLLAAVPLEDAPAGTWEGVRQRIAARAQAPARRAPLRLAWGAVGAAALVVIMLGVFLLWPMGGGEPGLIIATEPDEEMAATIEGHVPTVWAAPLADEAAIGLRLAAMENGG
ncbi:MAG: zf-HC2 domain-containing protein [Armatimonadetes bacterium]|nr:zf-HC2 domain-containing protein [Armatimonadota bacterium]